MESDNFLSELQQYKQINLIGPMISIEVVQLIEKLPTIFVDGGVKAHPQISDVPTLRIGDGDSSNEPMDICLSPNKDFTDLNYTLNLIPDHIEEIHCWGFLGGRKDHEIVNFGEFHQFLKKSKSKTEVFIEKQFIGFNNPMYHFEHQGLFSLLNFEDAQIKVVGDCQYPLNQKTPIKPLSGFTISNIASGTVHLESDSPLFIYLGQ